MIIYNCKKNRHKYRPRYDRLENKFLERFEFRGFGGKRAAKELLYNKIYLYDICEKCGKIINREHRIKII